VYLSNLGSARLPGVKALIIGWLLARASGCSGQVIHLESTGARFGFNPIGHGSHFLQAEGFVNWNLPWGWDLGPLWHLQSRTDVSAGWIGESSEDAAIVTAGLSLVLTRQRSPLSFEAGLSPTALTHYDFPSKNFGIPFQFTTHVGFNLDVSSRIRFSYRFQHMSNGGLGDRDPGLNLHMLGLSYLF
jgi:hypothetical protein